MADRTTYRKVSQRTTPAKGYRDDSDATSYKHIQLCECRCSDTKYSAHTNASRLPAKDAQESGRPEKPTTSGSFLVDMGRGYEQPFETSNPITVSGFGSKITLFGQGRKEHQPSSSQKYRNEPTPGASGSGPETDITRMELAMKQAADSIKSLRTFDDLEEIMEIHSCDEIRKSLQAFIDEKRENLRLRESRRESEFLDRQKNFMKRAVKRIADEQEAHRRSNKGLITLLQEQANSVAVEDTIIQINTYHKNQSGYDKFKPSKESTRLHEDRRRRAGAKYEACGCRSNQQACDDDDTADDDQSSFL